MTDQSDDPNEYDDTHGSHVPPAERAPEPLVELVSSSPTPAIRPLHNRAGRAVLTVQHNERQRLGFHVAGAWSGGGEWSDGWPVDFGALNVQMRDMGALLAAHYRDGDLAARLAWQRGIQDLGRQMYDGLLAAHPALADALTRLRWWALPAHRLTLAFAGPDPYLSVPYELMIDGGAGIPLALRHPICRQLTGPVPGDESRGQDWAALIARLRQCGQKLRVLLISSGAEQVGATDEIGLIERVIEQAAVQAGLAVAIDLMLAGDATPDQVRARLRACPYHVVHYAGQVYLDAQHPDQSGLLFAARHDSVLGQIVLGGTEFAALLAGGMAQIVYVSSTVERAPQPTPTLRTGDDLGLVRAVARAGVPYVIGVRWFTTSSARQQIAAEFYRHSLTLPQVPEIALLRARQAVARRDRHDESWIAPLLIARDLHCGGG